jgi:hypothetical protein
MLVALVHDFSVEHDHQADALLRAGIGPRAFDRSTYTIRQRRRRSRQRFDLTRLNI